MDDSAIPGPPMDEYDPDRGTTVTGRGWTAIITCSAVPYQLEGHLDTGEALYWRSRHRGWQFGIGYQAHVAASVAMQTHGDMPKGAMGIRQVVANYGHPLGGERAADVIPIIDALVCVYRAGFALAEGEGL